MISDKAIQYTLDHLSEREARFSEKDILRATLQHGLVNTTLKEINASFHKAVEHRQAIALKTNNTRPQNR